MDGEDYRKLLEESERRQSGSLNFTDDEREKFKKAFDDPEFRKLFAGYMDELQNPANRKETEDYIRQLEGDQKVPAGKEIIRPDPGFVAKTHKVVEGSSDDKVFLNIVSSDKIAEPTSAKADKVRVIIASVIQRGRGLR